MTDIKTVFSLFPERIQRALAAFEGWERISEIRLRCERPLSLTCFSGNIFLSSEGKAVGAERALCATSDEIRFVIASFCKGSLYRYFDTLKEGYLVDERGFRLAVCPEKNSSSAHLGERFESVSLRLARQIPEACDAFFRLFPEKKPISTLILSPPGGGKTTLLRSLAIALSRGEKGFSAQRVAVIDERKEILPQGMKTEAGLLDVLYGYPKGEGIGIAVRLFSPQVILCDEIGTTNEAEAITEAVGGGCILFASAHADSLKEAQRRPFLRELIENRVFSCGVLLHPIAGEHYRVKMERFAME